MSLKKVDINTYEITGDANTNLKLLRSIGNILLESQIIKNKMIFHAITCDKISKKERTKDILWRIIYYITSQMEYLESCNMMIDVWSMSQMWMVDDKRIFYMGPLVALNDNNIVNYCKFVEEYAYQCNLDYIERKRISLFIRRCKTYNVILWL